eukprot:CAMPEP_0114264406 /NCGR_PEP_ID=MMETSP0058-20121206/23181_1 /TAXON_ID=36894 /ORGANISM="Pyramimonas parkeae, CCMP726" /LENGTH=167 /DNA_ID=CAMNT_0001381061 /DNA_START=262 /DNA_END=765 /DNA_ORIENTATION=+
MGRAGDKSGKARHVGNARGHIHSSAGGRDVEGAVRRQHVHAGRGGQRQRVRRRDRRAELSHVWVHGASVAAVGGDVPEGARGVGRGGLQHAEVPGDNGRHEEANRRGGGGPARDGQRVRANRLLYRQHRLRDRLAQRVDVAPASVMATGIWSAVSVTLHSNFAFLYV